jgi:hypothetical protein
LVRVITVLLAIFTFPIGEVAYGVDVADRARGGPGGSTSDHTEYHHLDLQRFA